MPPFFGSESYKVHPNIIIKNIKNHIRGSDVLKRYLDRTKISITETGYTG